MPKDKWTSLEIMNNKNNKPTVKEIIERLRGMQEKQKIAEKKVVREKLLQEQKIAKGSCKICGDTVTGIMNHSKKLTDDITTLKNMYKNNIFTIREKGLTLTRDDIEARIEREKCSIQQSFNRYTECCKEGILPISSRLKY